MNQPWIYMCSPWCSISWVPSHLLLCSPIWRHLDCFHFILFCFVSIDIVQMSIFTHFSWGSTCKILSEIDLQVAVLAHACSFLHFKIAKSLLSCTSAHSNLLWFSLSVYPHPHQCLIRILMFANGMVVKWHLNI